MERTRPPGWYNDPDNPSETRWWTGTEWGEYRWEIENEAHAIAGDSSDGLDWAEGTFAVLLPVVGLVLGIVALTRGETERGSMFLILTVVGVFIWSAIATAAIS